MPPLSRYDEMSPDTALVRVNPDRYEKELDTYVTYLSKYVEMSGPMKSVKVASVTQFRPAMQ